MKTYLAAAASATGALLALCLAHAGPQVATDGVSSDEPPVSDLPWGISSGGADVAREVQPFFITGLVANPHGPPFTDESLRSLRGAFGIKSLDLRRTEITDAGMEIVKGISGLHTLDISGTAVTDGGLRHLREVSSLQELHLGRGITDAGIVHLRKLRWLERLTFDIKTKLTDEGIVALEGLTRLSSLALRSPLITDAGMKSVAKLSGLTELDLSMTQVTDAGLDELVGLKSLRTLSVYDTAVTDAGIERFQEALPDCRVSKAILQQAGYETAHTSIRQ
ncbi:MAG: hypothetical protein ACR2RV_01660 [Verrucomicrobiales bacterium]